MSFISNFINLVFTQPIFNGLLLLYHLFGDLGVSIIVLTLALRLILFPLTLKQLQSTKATQQLQPRMAELKKKYANDQQMQAKAMQELYKEYGINPMAGCLPLLIQMPILYGLFYALRAVLADAVLKTETARLAALNGFIYPFLPHFAHFPSIYLTWFSFINHSWVISLGNADPTHVLPILAAVATFVQMRMSMARQQNQNQNAPKATDAMSQQMRMMQYLMPAITLFFGWTFPAGLALYWTTSSLFGMVQQYFVTGWGALLDTPLTSKTTGEKISSSSSASSNGSSKKSSVEQQKKAVLASENGEASTSEKGPVGSKLNNPSSSNGSSSTRRTRSSASARRRSNAPRRNPSRS